MLLIDRRENGITLDVRGDAPSVLAELGVLVEVIQEQVGGKMDVYSMLNDPLQKCLAKGYLKAIRTHEKTK